MHKKWHKVSEVMRRLVQQAGSDADKLEIYRCANACLTECGEDGGSSSNLCDRCGCKESEQQPKAGLLPASESHLHIAGCDMRTCAVAAPVAMPVAAGSPPVL